MADSFNISEIIEIISEIKPNLILDANIGTGKFGLLFREYLDGRWGGHDFHNPDTWSLNLVGINEHPDRLTPVHEYVYSAIWTGNVFNILTRGPAQHCFDLVFLNDVLEPLEKDNGIKLIRAIRDKWLCEHGHILISTPDYYKRTNTLGKWYAQEFRELGMVWKIKEGKQLTVLLST